MMRQPPKNTRPRSDARQGTCATCGAKNVLVSSPPLSRHIDVKACDLQRAANALKLRVLATFRGVPTFTTHTELDAAFGKGSLGR